MQTSDWQGEPNPPGRIGVSLSGGGHRAALFSAGAIAALIDAGLADEVVWIASASGGSLLNGLLATSGGMNGADPDRLVRSTLAATTTDPSSRLAWLRSCATYASSKLMERRIDRIWLGGNQVDIASCSAASGTSGAHHVILAVDLCSLQPVYLSGDFIVSNGLSGEDPLAVTPAPGALSLARAVRSSAAFPMALPSVRLPIKALGEVHESSDGDCLVLSDGGLWSNLATSWYSAGRPLAWKVEPPMPSEAFDVDLHLVVDASAPPKRSTGRWYTRPGAGRIGSAMRSGQAMLQSTIEHQRADVGRYAQWNPGGDYSHVHLGRSPADVCPRSALMESLGGSKLSWSETRNRARAVKTTLGPVDREDALALVALGYGLTSAHLTGGWSIPFCHFSDPFRRFS